MDIIIKNIPQFCCCYYCFFRLLNIRIEKKHSIVFLFSIPMAFLSLYLNQNYPYATYLSFVFFSFILLFTLTKKRMEVVMTTLLLSYGISYITVLLACLPVALVQILYGGLNLNHMVLYQCIISIFNVLFTILPFRLKRLRKGMPFLKSSFYCFPCMILGILILFTSILYMNVGTKRVATLSLFALFLFFLIIFLLWQNRLTKLYVDRLKRQDFDTLNKTILQIQQQLDETNAENARLAKIIHEDNKLIPSLELAVRSFLAEGTNFEPAYLEKGNQLMDELHKVSSTRKGILRHQDLTCQKLSKTGLLSIDTMFQYMQQKAQSENILLQLSLTCDVSFLTKSQIKEESLRVLLSDLIENAIIATKYNAKQNIFISICIVEKQYSISIMDSGIPFTNEVLLSLGNVQTTTHKEDGGSGIGLMSTSEILKDCNASLQIEEYVETSSLYTKKVSVIFNQKNDYTFLTYKEDKDTMVLRKRPDLIVIHKM